MRISDWSSDVCSSDLLSGIGRLRDIPRPGHAIHDDPLGIMAHAIDVRNRNAALFEQLEDRGLARQAGKCLGINPFISTNVEGDRAAVAADFRIPARTPAWLPLQHCHASADQPLNLPGERSEEHTSELPSLMRISYAVFCLNKKPTI